MGNGHIPYYGLLCFQAGNLKNALIMGGAPGTIKIKLATPTPSPLHSHNRTIEHNMEKNRTQQGKKSTHIDTL